MKRLIVNADDFGLTLGVNRAIAECHQHGIVSSTTLMATGARFEEAVALASQLPGLSVGCHVVLVDGEPVLPASEVRSLLAPGTNRFYHGIGEVLRAVATRRFRPEEIEAEAGAQIARLQSAGVRVSHFDAHKHTHMFPAILRPLLRAASAHGVRAVRNPFEPINSMRPQTVFSNWELAARWAEVTVLRAFRRSVLRLVKESGLWTTDGSLGVALTGKLGIAVLSEMLEHMPDGCWELVCHPGYNDSELAGVRTRLRESRLVELQTLSDPRTRAIAERLGIRVISFAEFTSAKPDC